MDTSFFYVIPWQVVLGLFVGLLALVLTTVYTIRRFVTVEQEHEDGSEVPLFVHERKDHTVYEHDINLKS